MVKWTILILITIGIFVAAGVLLLYPAPENKLGEELSGESAALSDIRVFPISHATFVVEWGNTFIYNDPVGGDVAFLPYQPADIILVSDIHGDHLNIETLEAVVGDSTVIIAPQAVADEFTETLLTRTLVLANGERTIQEGITIEAVPMYNLPGSAEAERHTKGRGNGYLLERDGARVYIAGDTAGIPEMRALTDIDMAFVPMNLPYTMGVEEAADAVLDFAPRQIWPYHYRGQGGLADTGHFKELVNAGNPDIEVMLRNWYPES